jgi:hypothetical protein
MKKQLLQKIVCLALWDYQLGEDGMCQLSDQNEKDTKDKLHVERSVEYKY